MPGPVSDSYDPEFGTGDNAQALSEEIQRLVYRITTESLGHKLHNIIEVVFADDGKEFNLKFSEKELRIIRFCLNRALESI